MEEGKGLLIPKGILTAGGVSIVPTTVLFKLWAERGIRCRGILLALKGRNEAQRRMTKDRHHNPCAEIANRYACSLPYQKSLSYAASG